MQGDQTGKFANETVVKHSVCEAMQHLEELVKRWCVPDVIFLDMNFPAKTD